MEAVNNTRVGSYYANIFLAKAMAVVFKPTNSTGCLRKYVISN